MRFLALIGLFLITFSSFSQPKGKVAKLSGRETYLAFDNIKKFGQLDQVTLSIWAYHSNWESVQEESIVSCLEYGGFSIGKRDNEVYASVMRNNYQTVFYPAGKLLPGWHQIALTYDGSTLKLYVDGYFKTSKEFDHSMQIVYPEVDLPLIVGGELGDNGQPAGSRFFYGQVDNLELYNRALSDQEMLRLFRGDFSHDKSLLYFTFDHCDTLCQDASGDYFLTVSEGVQFPAVWFIPLKIQLWWRWLDLVLAVSFLIFIFIYTYLDSWQNWLILLFGGLVAIGALMNISVVEVWFPPMEMVLYEGLLTSLVVGIFFYLLALSQDWLRKYCLYAGVIFIVSGVLGFVVHSSMLFYVWFFNLLIFNVLIVVYLTIDRPKSIVKYLLLAGLLIINASWILAYFFGLSHQDLLPFDFVSGLILLGTAQLVLNKRVYIQPAQDLLSKREREVADFIMAGLSDKQIAEEMFVSFNTVRTHVRNIYKKLGVTSRVEAVAAIRKLLKSDK